jgi:hypothetical protein
MVSAFFALRLSSLDINCGKKLTKREVKRMSEIATLEMLEPHLAGPATVNNSKVSHLEAFFSEVRYSTFVAR